MAVLFPHNQLKIMDYNRVVKDLNGLTEEQFLAKVGEKFEVAPTAERSPEAPAAFGMFLGGKWYALKAKTGSFPASDPVKSLDVSILQENLLAPDPRHPGSPHRQAHRLRGRHPRHGRAGDAA